MWIWWRWAVSCRKMWNGNSETMCNGRVEDIPASIGPNGNAMYSEMRTLPLKICTQLRCLQGEMQLGNQKESEARCDRMQLILNCLKNPKHSGCGLGLLPTSSNFASSISLSWWLAAIQLVQSTTYKLRDTAQVHQQSEHPVPSQLDFLPDPLHFI